MQFGNNSTGCWLCYGGDCLTQRQYIVKFIGNVSDWLSYAGRALIKVADSAGSTVTPKSAAEFCPNSNSSKIL